MKLFSSFFFQLTEGRHNFARDEFRILLTNVAPSSDDRTVADIVEIERGGGYPLGGLAVTITRTHEFETFALILSAARFRAVGGTIGPLRYAVLQNASAGGLLVAWWDYGAEVTLQSGERFTVDTGGIRWSAAGIESQKAEAFDLLAVERDYST